MFRFFSKKPDFNAVFSTDAAFRQYAYGNRSKTAEIMGSEDFIHAWLESERTEAITAVISQEALRGDIPSLKQMIWLCEGCFDNAADNSRNASELIAMRTQFMTDRVKFCQKAIECGLPQYSYTAMSSSAKLYLVRYGLPGSADDPITQWALKNIITYANMVIASRDMDAEFVKDARDAIEYYGPVAAIIEKL